MWNYSGRGVEHKTKRPRAADFLRYRRGTLSFEEKLHHKLSFVPVKNLLLKMIEVEGRNEPAGFCAAE